jgi:hypothetical protein
MNFALWSLAVLCAIAALVLWVLGCIAQGMENIEDEEDAG